MGTWSEGVYFAAVEEWINGHAARRWVVRKNEAQRANSTVSAYEKGALRRCGATGSADAGRRETRGHLAVGRVEERAAMAVEIAGGHSRVEAFRAPRGLREHVLGPDVTFFASTTPATLPSSQRA